MSDNWTAAELAGMGYVIENGRAIRRSPTEAPKPDQPIAAEAEPGAECEEDVQQAIITGLAAEGFTVLQTSVRIRKCEHCGGWPAKARYGSTPGVPDLLVTADWPLAAFAGIEVKGPKTPLSDAQKELEAAGRIVVVRSSAAAIEATRRVDVVMKAVSEIRKH